MINPDPRLIALIGVGAIFRQVPLTPLRGAVRAGLMAFSRVIAVLVGRSVAGEWIDMKTAGAPRRPPHKHDRGRGVQTPIAVFRF